MDRAGLMSASADEPETERLVTPLFALITASGLFYFLAIGSLLPTLPRYVEDELGGSGFEVGLVVGAFAVSAALIRPTAGRLGDIVGRRTMALVGSGIAAVSIVPLGLVHAVWFLILVRLVTGLGEASFFIGAATAAQDLSPDDRRGEAASFFSIAVYGGLAFGPAAGEWIYRTHGSDTMWLAAAASCSVSLVLAAFIPRELGRSENPPPRRGLLHPAAILPGSVLLLGILGFTGYAAFVPLYVDEIGLEDAGPFFFAYGAIVLLVRVVGAKIPDRLGVIRTSTLALTSIGVGVGTVAAFASPAGLWVGTVLLSIGMSLLFPALFTLAVQNAPADERSHAVGTFSLFFDLSQGLGAPALGLLVTIFGGERAAFVGGAVMAVMGLVLTHTKLRSSMRVSAPAN
ncbi:MAG: MFS transporter [Acidimicrobiales bacterium]